LLYLLSGSETKNLVDLPTAAKWWKQTFVENAGIETFLLFDSLFIYLKISPLQQFKKPEFTIYFLFKNVETVTNRRFIIFN